MIQPDLNLWNYMDTCFRIIEMAVKMYPGGWEVESDAGTNHSEEKLDRVFSSNELYDAGIYGRGRRAWLSSANGAGLLPEEEQNFRREARRAEKSRPKTQLRLTKSMEDLIKTFPLIHVDDNKDAEGDEV